MTNSKIAALILTVISVGLSGCGLGVDSSSSAASAVVDREPFTGYVPKAVCGPDDLVETGLQGQVPWEDRLSGRAGRGYSCNLKVVSQHPSRGFANFDAYKDCVYYSDNAGGSGMAEGGGVVVDLSDPLSPVQTDYLTARALGNPGESLKVNHKRGLLVANHYNSSQTAPNSEEYTRSFAVYDISQDCRRPKLLADVLMPTQGHEGCFQPDGMVYYSSPAGPVSPIDLSDPSNPRPLSDPWAHVPTHGCTISDDGKRGVFSNSSADGSTSGILIVDTTEVQERRAGAQPTLVSEFRPANWGWAQNANVLSYDGHPYVFAFTETTLKPDCAREGANFGYAVMLDIADEANPVLVSEVKLEVHDPADCEAVSGDKGPQTSGADKGDPFYQILAGVFTYDFHYCRPDREHNPTVMACVNFGSGLRVFDIRDPYRPKEIAYYNTGTVDTAQGPVLDFVLSPPVLRRDLGQIWWVTNYRGLHVAQFREGVWPFPGDEACVDGYDDFADQYDPTYCRSTWSK